MTLINGLSGILWWSADRWDLLGFEEGKLYNRCALCFVFPPHMLRSVEMHLTLKPDLV